MEPGVTAVRWSPESPAGELPGAGAAMRRVLVKAGHVAIRHHHGHEQFLFVVSGAGRLECEAGSIPLQPGTALRLEAGAWHSAEFAADTVLLELNISPSSSAA